MTTTIRNDQSRRILSSLTRATSRALTRGMQAGRTHATRAVAAELGTSATAVRRRLILERASTEEGVVSVGLRFTGKRLRLGKDLGGRQTKAGVSYRTRGGRALAKGAFLATLRSGHTGAFIRRLPTLSRKGQPRHAPALHIQELYAASVPFVAIKNKILESTLEAAVAAFQKNHAHEVGRAVSGAA